MAEAPVKQRETLYKLMISQLRYDGCEAVAAALAKTTNIISPCFPSARLNQVVNLGIAAEAEGAKPEPNNLPGLTLPPTSDLNTKGIDLEYESDECNGMSTNGHDGRAQHHDEIRNARRGMSNGGDINSDVENIPPSFEVRRHIMKITSNRVAADEINVVSSNGEQLIIGDGLNADDVCAQVKRELQKMNVSQEVFAKCVLGKTQGYLSEMLKHGERVFCPSEKSSSKGRMNFERMRQFLARPEPDRRRIYTDMAQTLRMERMARKRLSLTMMGSPVDVIPKKSRFISDEARSVMEEYYNNCGQQTSSSGDRLSMVARDEAKPSHLAACSKLNSPTPSPAEADAEFFRSLNMRKNLETELRAAEFTRTKEEPATSPKQESHHRRMLASHSCPTFVKSEFLSPVRGELPQCPPQVRSPRPPKDRDRGLIADKIAALTRNQPLPKPKQVKMPALVVNPKMEQVDEEYHETNIEREPSPGVRQSLHDTHDMYSSSHNAVPIETLPLDSLADMDSSINPLVLHEESSDSLEEEPSDIEIGQRIYVVRVDGTDTISVTSSY